MMELKEFLINTPYLSTYYKMADNTLYYGKSTGKLSLSKKQLKSRAKNKAAKKSRKKQRR